MKKIAAIILGNDKGEILLYLLDNKPGIPFPNYWDLIGGHVEEGKRPQYFSREDIPNVKFANILKYIVMEYINDFN
jgi:8-oxo-dGTP pyrophosphatase MutT (NUDIX family)